MNNKTIYNRFKNMKSENWGGLSSFAGSTLVLAVGDIAGAVSTALFTASEYAFYRKGHTSLGYSAGMAGLALGDAVLIFSAASAGNTLLQFSLAALSVTLAVGALRHPLRLAAFYCAKNSRRDTAKTLFKMARAIPPFVGTASLIQRIPTLYHALFSGEKINTVLAAAVSLWGLSDILNGRLQSNLIVPVRKGSRHLRARFNLARHGATP